MGGGGGGGYTRRGECKQKANKRFGITLVEIKLQKMVELVEGLVINQHIHYHLIDVVLIVLTVVCAYVHRTSI